MTELELAILNYLALTPERSWAPSAADLAIRLGADLGDVLEALESLALRGVVSWDDKTIH